MDGLTLVRDLAAYDERGAPPRGAELARCLKRIIALETEEGGPYAAEAGGSADPGVSLAVARFLAAAGIALPKLDAYLARSLSADTLLSRAAPPEMLATLAAWYRSRGAHPAPSAPEAVPPAEARMQERILAAARERFAPLPEPFAARAQSVIERTMRGNPDRQMSLMPYYLREALGEAGERFDDADIAALGLANVFFWTAFIIYDDFWDEDEAADPKLLPVANLMARHYASFFATRLPEDEGFLHFFHFVMDKLDTANGWETASCRARVEGSVFSLPEALPEYGEYEAKFYPAAGHVLGPVAMLASMGHAPASPEAAHLIAYFRHYLIGMQLNDDAHDWKEDLFRGNLSTAVVPLLAAFRNAHPERSTLDLAADMPELERLFWSQVLSPICCAVLAHATRSREALSALAFLKDPAPLARFIERNERIAEEALDAFAESESFLSEFRS